MIHFVFLFMFFFIKGFKPSGERLHSQPDAGVAPGDLAAPQQFGNGKDHLVSALCSFRSNIIRTYLLKIDNEIAELCRFTQMSG